VEPRQSRWRVRSRSVTPGKQRGSGRQSGLRPTISQVREIHRRRQRDRQQLPHRIFAATLQRRKAAEVLGALINVPRYGFCHDMLIILPRSVIKQETCDLRNRFMLFDVCPGKDCRPQQLGQREIVAAIRLVVTLPDPMNTCRPALSRCCCSLVLRSSNNILGKLHGVLCCPDNLFLVREAAAAFPALFRRRTSAGAIHTGVWSGAVLGWRDRVRNGNELRTESSDKQDSNGRSPVLQRFDFCELLGHRTDSSGNPALHTSMLTAEVPQQRQKM